MKIFNLIVFATLVSGAGLQHVLAASCDTPPFEANSDILVVKGTGNTLLEANENALALISSQIGSSQVKQHYSSIKNRNESHTLHNISTRTTADIDHTKVTLRSEFCNKQAITWLRYDNRNLLQQLTAFQTEANVNITLPDYLSSLPLPYNPGSTRTVRATISPNGGISLVVGGQQFALSDADITAYISPPNAPESYTYQAGSGLQTAGYLTVPDNRKVNVSFCNSAGRCHEIYNAPPGDRKRIPLLTTTPAPERGWLVISSLTDANTLPTEPQQRFAALLNGTVANQNHTAWLRVNE